MTAPKRSRNSDVRRRRGTGVSQRALARRFGISRWRIQQILDETGGDPLWDERIAAASATELERERSRLTDRVGCDLRRLIIIEEELGVRRVDGVLGLTG